MYIANLHKQDEIESKSGDSEYDTPQGNIGNSEYWPNIVGFQNYK